MHSAPATPIPYVYASDGVLIVFSEPSANTMFKSCPAKIPIAMSSSVMPSVIFKPSK